MIYPVRRMPRDLPRKLLMDSWDRPQAAFVYSLGTYDAIKLMVDTASWLHRAGKIDRVLVVTDRSMSGGRWAVTIGYDLPYDLELHFDYYPAKARETAVQELGKEPLQFYLVYAEDAFKAAADMENYLFKGRALMVVDTCNAHFTEPMDQGSMALSQISHHAPYRRIMMGRLPRMPHQAWMPYKILSGDGPHLLGYPSALAMRMRYFKNQEVTDYEAFAERARSAPTYFMTKEEMTDVEGPIIVQTYSSSLRTIIKEVPGKIAVFHHFDKKEDEDKMLSCIGQALHEQSDYLPGQVLVAPEWIKPEVPCPERRAFFNDPRAQVLVLKAHCHPGRLDAAHASIYIGHCNSDTTCCRNCEELVRWNENRHKVTHFRMNL